ncbi:Piwi-domain-containing protein [Hypoxylon sp. FL1284]|nr:Piwi-domain-containing protein [Hypoxylon sp. FL1284]
MASKMSGLKISSDKGSKQPSDERIPHRPAYGTKGTEVILWANYFALTVKTPSLYRYTLEVTRRSRVPRGNNQQEPEAKGTKRQAVIQSALNQVAKGIKYATEFKSQVLSLARLPLPDNQIVEVSYGDEGKDDTYAVKFNPSPDVDMDAMRAYVRTMNDPPGSTGYPKFSDAADALTIIAGHWARTRTTDTATVGSNRYFFLGEGSEKQSLGGPEYNTVIRGYVQSARLATGRLLLNVNVTHGVFRPEGPVPELMQGVGHPQQQSKFLARLRCYRTIPGPKSRKIKGIICGLAMPGDGSGSNKPKVPRVGATANEVSFYLEGAAPPGLSTNAYCTVAQYYLKKYGYKAQPNLPVVNMKTRQKTDYVPAELLEVIPGQPLRRKTTPNETAEMIKFACRSPFENATSLVEAGRKCLGLDGGSMLAEFNVTADKNLLTVRGRELLTPGITYSNKNFPSYNGSWNMRGAKVVKSGRSIDRWSWIHIEGAGGRPQPNHDELRDAMGAFVRYMRNDSGIAIAANPCRNPVRVFLENGNILHQLKDKFRMLCVEQRPQLVFVVLPGKKTDTEIYNAVKYLGDVEFGVHTVCVLSSNIKKGAPQYFANVGLKVNLKMGGINHQLSNNLKVVNDGKTMLVGYDVIHPTNLAGSAEGLPSLVGMVSSVDRFLAQFPATAWAQAGRQEMLDETLEEKFKGRIRLWQRHNKNQLPQNIIIFRDGVSESQFDKVLDEELPLMRKACKALYPPNQPAKIAIIVSVKRHATRFYPTDKSQMSSTGNIKPGTVVDRGVTQARTWDFFLTAHEALQGTARPAHYTVLLDEIFRPALKQEAANGLEALTHEMCYLFGRATRAVSICPPAYYADIVCTRQRVYVADYFDRADNQSSAGGSTARAAAAVPNVSVHPNLQDSMYYI